MRRYLIGLLAPLSSCIIITEPPPPPPPPPADTGDILFDYAVLENDGAGGIEANDCEVAGVDTVRFSVGDDLNGDGVLGDDEVVEFVEAPCNQVGDVNGDGQVVLEDGELGSLLGIDFTADTYTSFSIELLDVTAAAIPFRLLDDPASQTLTEEATKFTFGEITIFAGQETFLPFVGDANQQGQELQIFLGF